MKKAFLLVCILTISVATTACINSFAIQELNNKAMSYIEQENYDEAIERLKSSIDLDSSVFESHYNLAVAYTKAEKYPQALESYKKAIELKPEFADSYYSIAVTEKNIVTDIEDRNIKLDASGNYQPVDKENLTDENLTSFDQKTQQRITELLEDAKSNFETYLEKAPNAEDKAEVQEQLKSIEERLSDNAEVKE